MGLVQCPPGREEFPATPSGNGVTASETLSLGPLLSETAPSYASHFTRNPAHRRRFLIDAVKSRKQEKGPSNKQANQAIPPSRNPQGGQA